MSLMSRPPKLLWFQGLFNRVPAIFVNAASAAIGVGAIEWLLTSAVGTTHAQLAISGAICASLSDVPGAASRIARRVALAAALSFLAALVVQTTLPNAWLFVLGLFVIGFASMMTMAWGIWATSVSFAPLLSTVFAMTTPSTADPWSQLAGWNVLGGLLYVGWAVVTGWLLQRRYCVLAVSDSLLGFASLLRARAALLEPTHLRGTPLAAMQTWARGEAALAEQIQSARDLVFALSPTDHERRHGAILLRAIELRDILLASRLDLDLLGVDRVGRTMIQRITSALRAIAADIEESADELTKGRIARPTPPALGFAGLFDGIEFAEEDARRRLVPSLYNRLGNLVRGAADIRELLRCGPHEIAIEQRDLMRFVVAERWPLRTVVSELHAESPIFRHATRMAIAVVCAYLAGSALPWASHPHWLVLSIAVMLRGNLAQTLARRNARVVGTLLGCATVASLSLIHSDDALHIIFLIAVGVAHAFITRRYWLTAAAATVMALLQTHLITGSSGFAVAERAADTLLGALLAWGFSYVLPSWERRSLPRSIERAIMDLGDYASRVLAPVCTDLVAMRLVRRKAYDSLNAISDAMQRSGVEPLSVQIPLDEFVSLIDHAQRFMAHLAMVRVMVEGQGLDSQRAEVAAQLAHARLMLKRALLRSSPARQAAGDIDDHEHISLVPDIDPAEDALPWLTRRLKILSRDAERLRSSANGAISRLEAQQGIQKSLPAHL